MSQQNMNYKLFTNNKLLLDWKLVQHDGYNSEGITLSRIKFRVVHFYLYLLQIVNDFSF